MRIGIDLGGTKIEGIALAADGTIPTRHRVPTPRSYDGVLDAIAGVVRAVEQGAPDAAGAPAGVGIPGAVVPGTGLVKNANSVWLNGRPLGRDLEARLARPVRLMNDANCFALSEAADGAGAGAGVAFGVILGTGVGGGAVVHGRALEGPNRLAGEWGHSPLPWPAPDELPGPACYCGKRGCVETFLSGPSLARDHERHAGLEERSVTAEAVVAAAAAGDAAAIATMARYHDRLARALAALVVHVLDPDVVVLGGGLSNVPGLAEAAQAGLARYAFSAAGPSAAPEPVATRVVRNRHGDSSGVRGAAWLWP